MKHLYCSVLNQSQFSLSTPVSELCALCGSNVFSIRVFYGTVDPMKLGYQTHPRRDLIEEIRWIGENGFAFVDLFFEPVTGAFDVFDPVKVREALTKYQLDCTGHLAWYLPIGSPMLELRQAAITIARNYFPAFKTAGCLWVTVHAHWPPSLFTVDEGIAWQIGTLKQIMSDAAAHGLRIMYEPVGMIQESEGNLRRIFNALPELGFHLDIGHFHLNSRQPADFIRAFSDRLVHVHLHDNDGSKDQHLPPGTGRIDWDETIKALKTCYDGTITLEVFTDTREYVLTARDLVLKKWETTRV